jgi:parallel beta-helix repeat protein
MKTIIAVILTMTYCSGSIAQTNVFPTSGNVGIGTTTPGAKLDVRGDIYNTGSVFIDGGDLILHRTTHAFGYVARPNTVGFKKLQFGVAGGGPLEDLYLNADRSYFTGRVGIGVAVPAEKLTVAGSSGNIYIGNTLFDGGYNGIFLNGSTTPFDYNFLSKSDDKNLYINRPTNHAIYFRMGNNTQMVISPNGNVGVGTENISGAGYKLYVETGIRTRKVTVDQLSWADYVFEEDYPLPSLAEVALFIKQHKHLPEIPSAKEIATDGLNLGENQVRLLKKIEELTLYLIEQDKKLQAQQEQIKMLQLQINSLMK